MSGRHPSIQCVHRESGTINRDGVLNPIPLQGVALVNFSEEVDRNFGMKFLREEVTDGGAVDRAWIRGGCLRLSLYKATCAALVAVECRLEMGNSEFRDLIDEIELCEYEELETAVWRVLLNMHDLVNFTFSSY